MVKHTQTIRRQIAVCLELQLSVFDHFVGLALKGLILIHRSFVTVIIIYRHLIRQFI